MVLLVEFFFQSIKFSSKLENHHHQHEALSEASLQAFRSDVSKGLNRLLSKLEPGSDSISLLWIRNCFDMLLDSNKAYAKLVMEIDYPMSKWEIRSVEEYLSYSLNLLELLNSVKSCLSQLGHARLSMTHALSLIECSPPSALERLRSIQYLIKNLNRNLKSEEEMEERNGSGKEWVLHQALMEMKRNSYLVFGIVLSGLSGDIKPALELKKSARDLKYFERFFKKNVVVKELKEVDEAAACLVAAMEIRKSYEDGGEDHVKQLERKLEEMQKLLDDIGKEADDLFSEILAGRNELLHGIRRLKQ